MSWRTKFESKHSRITVNTGQTFDDKFRRFDTAHECDSGQSYGETKYGSQNISIALVRSASGDKTFRDRDYVVLSVH